MMTTPADDNSIQIELCAKCFTDQGLRLEATRIGQESDECCPNCGATDGRKLDKERVKSLAHRFFVRGTYHRTTYGGAPIVQMNEHHYGRSNIKTPDSLKDDVALIERSAGIGFFYYGPNMWMVGETSPLNALQDKERRAGVIAEVMATYPTLTLRTDDTFYRLRTGLTNPTAHHEYDSPPIAGGHRFDSEDLPILYASRDLEVCLHECRVSVEDELYVGTLRPARDLTLLNLTEVVFNEEDTEFESLDIAMFMLFQAGEHSYEICRDIAIAANTAGLDGIVYPSYFSAVLTGQMPIETAYGLSIRRFKRYKAHVRDQISPNLALFGRPVRTGSVLVECVNRLVITNITYDGVLGPVDYLRTVDVDSVRPQLRERLRGTLINGGFGEEDINRILSEIVDDETG